MLVLVRDQQVEVGRVFAPCVCMHVSVCSCMHACTYISADACVLVRSGTNLGGVSPDKSTLYF